jgi:hypothetical protein
MYKPCIISRHFEYIFPFCVILCCLVLSKSSCPIISVGLETKTRELTTITATMKTLLSNYTVYNHMLQVHETRLAFPLSSGNVHKHAGCLLHAHHFHHTLRHPRYQLSAMQHHRRVANFLEPSTRRHRLYLLLNSLCPLCARNLCRQCLYTRQRSVSIRLNRAPRAIVMLRTSCSVFIFVMAARYVSSTSALLGRGSIVEPSAPS